jgi:hypothetical protein
MVSHDLGPRGKIGRTLGFLRSHITLLVGIGVLVLLISYFLVIPYINSRQSVSGSQSLVPLDQIVSGGPPMDGIPSIDHPKFIEPNQANFLSNSDIVIGINYNGEAKAYPLLIMVWHEIVNDFVGGKPIAITYCPLCYSTAAFVRIIDGKTVEFGTSGKLYNNNLVMYDRLTKSYWSEILGEAIAGTLAGHKLETVPIDIMPWGEWEQFYPNTWVLSTDTGFARVYGTDPYEAEGYYGSPIIYFPLSHIDNRLPVKTIIVGLSINGVQKAYTLDNFTSKGQIIQDTVGGQNVVFFVADKGIARAFSPYVEGGLLHFQYINGNFVDAETQSIWNYDGLSVSGPLQGKSLARFATLTTFWFAWDAFHPNTQIYGT